MNADRRYHMSLTWYVALLSLLLHVAPNVNAATLDNLSRLNCSLKVNIPEPAGQFLMMDVVSDAAACQSMCADSLRTDPRYANLKEAFPNLQHQCIYKEAEALSPDEHASANHDASFLKSCINYYTKLVGAADTEFTNKVRLLCACQNEAIAKSAPPAEAVSEFARLIDGNTVASSDKAALAVVVQLFETSRPSCEASIRD